MSRAYRDSSGYGLVCGFGIYEPRVLCMRDSPEIEKAYQTWNGMLRRCEQKYVDKYPSYIGVSASEEFRKFADFAAWAFEQPGWGKEGWQLDKDLIVKGNKVYSPSTCVFLPRSVNMLLTKANKLRGDLPIGVKRFRHSQFSARMKLDGVDTRLGIFPSIDAAFQAYKKAKEANAKRIAEMHKEELDPRAYHALVSYNVEVSD